MSISNTFNWSRFLRVCKQNMIYKNKFVLLASVAFCGVVIIVLTLGQLGNQMEPFTIDVFLQIGVAFFSIFAILYAGYSFPAFRDKESSISYLMTPASSFEKLVFELLNRIVLPLVTIPLLFWMSFNVQGLFFELMTNTDFNPIGISDFSALDISPIDESFWVQALILSCAFLFMSLPFTGGALFSKQPLVKTLFSVAIILAVYFGMIYIIVEPLGLSNYMVNIDNDFWLIPSSEDGALMFFSCAAFGSAIIMLIVAFLKLKEKEV